MSYQTVKSGSKSNNTYEKSKQKKDQYSSSQKEYHVIDQPLSIYYKDKRKVFLPDGVAYQIAFAMGDIPPHQLRKILNQVKEAVTLVKKDEKKFEEARNKLYYLVPLTAYNVGRYNQLNPLYQFVCEHINEKSITNKDDIEFLDQLFTSIIAYHKFKKKQNTNQ